MNPGGLLEAARRTLPRRLYQQVERAYQREQGGHMKVWVVYNVNGGVVAVFDSEEAAYRKAGESRAYSKVEMEVQSGAAVA